MIVQESDSKEIRITLHYSLQQKEPEATKILELYTVSSVKIKQAMHRTSLIGVCALVSVN